MKLDAKFYGEIRKVKDDSVVSEDEWVAFLAKDNAFAAILPAYLQKCIALKCDDEQIAAVRRMMDRVGAWRESHFSLLKNPDAAGEKLLDAEVRR